MATSKKVSKPEESAGGVVKSDKKITFLLALIALLLTGALGGGAVWYFTGRNAPTADELAVAKPEPVKPPVFAALDPFVVNLQPEMGEQYLQVAMTLQVADQLQADQIKLYMPLVRSRLLTLLSSKKPSELTSTEGKNQLAEEITAILQQPFSAGSATVDVRSVFFTAFVIQ